MTRVGHASLVVLVLGALTARSASAQDAAADPETRAAELVERGLDLRESGDDVQARTLMTQAYDLAPTPRTSAQLGLVEQALGLWPDAERHLQQALTHADDEWIRSHRRALGHAVEIIGEHLGTLEVLANVPGATVSVHGSVVATLPSAPLRVQVGPTEIVVAAPGYHSQTFSLSISAGALSRQLVELEAVPAPEPEPVAPVATAVPPPDAPERATFAPRDTAPGGPTFLWSWVGLAATAIAGGVAIGTGVQTQSVYDGLSRSCGGPGCSSTQIAASGLEAWQTSTNALAITAGVLGAVTVTLFVVEGTSSGSAQITAGPTGVSVQSTF